MRKLLEFLTLILERHDPRIAGHVGDRILAADEFAIREPLVEHAVETVGLVHVAVDRVRNLVLRIIAEVMVLSGHWSEPAHLPERPLDNVIAAVEIGMEELAGLL